MSNLKQYIWTIINKLNVPRMSVGNKSLEDQVYDRYFMHIKDKLSQIQHDTMEESVQITAIEKFLSDNWKLVKGNALCYTAIPTDIVTRALCSLAEFVSLEKNKQLPSNEDLPCSALEILMPGLSIVSQDTQYPSYEVLKTYPELSQEEQQNYARLKRIRCITTELPSHEKPIDNHARSEQETRDQYIYLDRLKKLPIAERPNHLSDDLIAQEIRKLNIAGELLVNIKRYIEDQELTTLESKKTDFEKMQTLIHQKKYMQIRGYLVPNVDVFEVINTHILSEDGQSLIPLMILLDPNQSKRPYHDYEKNGAPSQEQLQKELSRLCRYSSYAGAYVNAQANLERITSDTSHFLGHLKELCKQLEFNDAHVGIGESGNAGSGVYAAILTFNNYYQELDETEKQKIPCDLRTEIDLLITLSSDVNQNENATENLQTCIGNRKTSIRSHIKGNEILLAGIETREKKESLIALAKDALNEAERQFREFYQSALPKQDPNTTPPNKIMRLVDNESTQRERKDRLPLSKDVLMSLGVNVSLNSLKDLNDIMELDNGDIKNILSTQNDKEKIVDIINNAGTLQNLFLELPLNKIEVFLSIIEPLLSKKILKNNGNNIRQLLFALSSEKATAIYTRMITYRTHILSVIFAHYPELPKAMLDRLTVEEQLAFIQEHDLDGNTVLHWVANNPDELSAILARYPTKNCLAAIQKEDIRGKSVLHFAVENPDSLKYLLSLFPDNILIPLIQTKDEDGVTVLHHAAVYNPQSLKLLLEFYPLDMRLAAVQELSDNGKTVLNESALYHPASLHQIFSLLPADKYTDALQVKDDYGKTVLHSAANNPDSLSFILTCLPLDARFTAVQKKDNHGKSVLHWAAQHPASLQLLLEKYPDLVPRSALQEKDDDGQTVLHYCAANSPDTLELLLARYRKSNCLAAALQEKDKDGKTVLHWATQSVKSLQIILGCYSEESGLAAILEKDYDGKTVLHWAVNNVDSLKFLLAYNPVLNRLTALQDKDGNGRTVLYWAANNPDSLSLLLRVPTLKANLAKACAYKKNL